MNKRLIIFILLMILAVLVGINARLHEQAYREQSRTEIRQMKLQLEDVTQTMKEAKRRIEEVQQSQAEVKAFFDRLNILPEQTVTYYAPYDSRGLCHDGTPNTTATGTKPRPGTMAVNPAVIPYGAEIAVIYRDGTVERGRAEDTGGMIRASRCKVDVFRWTHDEAVRDGKKEATVVWVW